MSTTIIVEDGSRTYSNANSYISVATLDAYAAARGITISMSDQTQLIIRSMDFIENLLYKGDKLSYIQPLQWPRANVLIDGYWVYVNVIPQQLIDGQCEVCLAIDNNQDQLADIARISKTEQIGPIKIDYMNGSATTLVRKISAKLWKILRSGPAGSSFLVGRG